MKGIIFANAKLKEVGAKMFLISFNSILNRFYFDALTLS